MRGDEASAPEQFEGTPMSGDADPTAGQREQRRCSQGHDDFRSDVLELEVEPPAIVNDLIRGGSLMESPFSPAGEVELLDRIGDVARTSFDSRFLHDLIQQPSGRSHEGPAFQILLIAGLLAHKGNRRAHGTFPRHDAPQMLRRPVLLNEAAVQARQ